MTYELMNDSVTLFQRPLLDRVTDIRQPVARHHLLDAELHRLMRGGHQLFCFGVDVSDRDRHGRVAMPTTVFHTEIEADDVALAKRSGPWNPVHDLIIDRSTEDR